MSTHDDNARDARLTPEERALAARLAKLGPQSEPSPALDARILAAAHAATQEAPDDAPSRTTGRPRRKATRWPAMFGFAASLAIACGIAWQLRPTPPVPASAPAAAARADAEEAVDYAPPPPRPFELRVPRPRELNVPVPPPAEAPAPRQRAKIRPATPADAADKPQAFARDTIVLDEAVHVPARAPAAPPPPAQAMERAAADNAGVAAQSMAAPVAPAAAKATSQAARAQRAVDAAAQARERAEPQYAEPDEEVVPPATADSPAVREAWLVRIRELVREGHLDAARDSLRAFRTRNPGHAVPEDLRMLEE